jgi:hypothetical protein
MDFALTGVLAREAITTQTVRQGNRPVRKSISFGTDHEFALNGRQEADHGSHVAGLCQAWGQRIGDHDDDGATAIARAEAMRNLPLDHSVVPDQLDLVSGQLRLESRSELAIC